MLEPTGLIRYHAMCNAIVECERIDEVMGIRDTAKALKAYLHEAQNVEAELKVARIRLRAERRAGEILREMADGGQRAKSGDAGGGTDGKGVRPSVAPTLADLGIEVARSSMSRNWRRFLKINSKPRWRVRSHSPPQLSSGCSTRGPKGLVERVLEGYA